MLIIEKLVPEFILGIDFAASLDLVILAGINTITFRKELYEMISRTQYQPVKNRFGYKVRELSKEELEQTPIMRIGKSQKLEMLDSDDETINEAYEEYVKQSAKKSNASATVTESEPGEEDTDSVQIDPDLSENQRMFDVEAWLENDFTRVVNTIMKKLMKNRSEAGIDSQSTAGSSKAEPISSALLRNKLQTMKEKAELDYDHELIKKWFPNQRTPEEEKTEFIRIHEAKEA